MDLALQVASEQHGVVSRPQLLTAGVSPRAIELLLARPQVRALHRGVYQVGAVAGPLAREMAAVLACGAGAVVGLRSAGALWRLLAAHAADGPVHVLVPWRRGADRPGILARRVRSLADEEVTTLHGVPITTPARTLFDLAAEVGARELERAVARAERNGIVGQETLRAMMPRYAGRPGSRAMALVLGAGDIAFVRSEAEERFLILIRDGRLPMPRVNVKVRGLEVDFYWPAARLVVEVDGFAYHGSRAAFERDRRRDGRLTAAGFRVLRVTWRELTEEPSAVLARVAQALAVR
jgi:very-short-patch-repair endonuclease